ncbi:PrsW family intramembrane metalloprotease [Corynebacterium sp.]|uniref:PrsW family intramembrane metalloprotease n=1 Tax=Corynebacterium sp. TaxID=1720 RepID=UPI0026E0A75E|nr:PrsW family intramembrane metalloprotease [Corynebacterium sp.]MDO5512642.1 PrsW family intramembrane metalloprotease [Corynebacterium sp.]
MSSLFRVTLITLSVIAVPVVLYFSATNFLISWVGASLGIVFAVVYLALVLWLLSRSPMWPEKDGAGWKWVVSSLLWGAGVSFGLIMIGGIPLMTLTERLGWKVVAASFGGAYPEEIAKVLGVGVILFTFRALNRPWHGLMTGAVIGLGFEVFENLLYGSFGATLHPNTDLQGSLDVWGLRVLAGPGLHIIFTALAGWGLGLAVFMAGRSRLWRIGVAGGWLFVAFALHFAWNLLWPRELWLMITYLVVAAIMYPLVIWVWIRAHRMAKADDSYAYSPAPVRSVV